MACSDMLNDDESTSKDAPTAMSKGAPTPVPIGWRFVPTDEELVLSYLSRKVALKSLPARVIEEIDASEFYSHHPRDLVDKNMSKGGEWYFFINHDEYYHGKVEKKNTVRDGIGFWRCAGKEEAISDSHGNNFASKIHSTFFTANPTGFRKTDWNMELYRLPNIHHQQESQREEWVVARLRRGKR